MEKLTQQQGRELLRLARVVLEKKITGRGTIPETADSRLLHKRGTFVTLTLNGGLRGCIGNIDPVKTMVAGVRDNAVSAALHDHRFPPLSGEELARVVISVSILTEPRRLTYRDGEDLLARLSPGPDGVILRKGQMSATFLPQVWEQLPDKEQFLSSLCRKAGLPADCWREGDAEIEIYHVQKFEEDDR